MLGAVAQYERQLIRLRLSAGKARKRAGGGYTGGRPRYGTRAFERALVAEDAESGAVNFAVALRRDGQSYRAIADALTKAGYAPRRARVWHPSVLRTMCQRGEAAVP